MEAHINFLASLIIHKYFSGTCILSIFDEHSTVSIDKHPVIIYQSRNGSLEDLKYPDIERCEGFVVSGRNVLNIFSNLEIYLQRTSKMRYHKRKYLIYSTNGLGIFFNTSTLWFVKDLLFIKFVHTNTPGAILTSLEGYFELFTHKYVGSSGNGLPILLDAWFPENKSFLYGRDLYPDKVRNQFGRPLKVIATDYIPYSDLATRTGSEMKTIVEYAKRFNYSLELTESNFWGKLFTNWTGIGILGGVVNDQFDVAFSALFALPFREIYVDFSKYTAYSQVTCLVPAPKEQEGWYTHAKVFSITLWLMTLMAYGFGGLTIYLIKLYENVPKRDDMKYIHPFIILTIFLSQALTKIHLPVRYRLRYIFILLLILSLLLSAIYNSRLSSILVVPIYEKEIRTSEDLADRNFPWGELQIDWALPLENTNNSISDVIFKNFLVETEDRLRELSIKNNFAFGMERLISGYFAIGRYIKPDIIHKYIVLKEDLYRQYTNFVLRKSSVLTPSLDTFMNRAIQSGLIGHWESEASILHLDTLVQKYLMTRNGDQTHVMRLQIRHVKGAFLIWGVGILLSILYLGIEIKNKGKTRKSRLLSKSINE